MNNQKQNEKGRKNLYSFRIKEQGPNMWLTHEVYADSVEEAREILCNTWLLAYDIGYHYIWCMYVRCNGELIFSGCKRIKEIEF